MVAVSKTLGPIHFEDLDPKRFESMVRGLLYDFRDWNKMESTGIAGSDEGFDIRAWEKKYIPTPSDDGDIQDGSVIPTDGNLWMIQCKRESGISPKKVEDIIDECIPDKTNVPHGYIIAASTNFSKKSFDKFAKKLQEKGVVEFHLWGKPELESMLMQPKFDRVLFSFFGISLVAKAKSKTSKIKAMISVKNKLRNILGDSDPRDKHRSILIKDINADKYPWTGEYPNFEKQPGWMEVEPYRYYPNGIIVRHKEHFGYIDLASKTWDCIEKIDNSRKESEMYKPSKSDPKTEAARDYWNHLPRKNRATIYKQGYIRYKDILTIDEKGDLEYDFPHIYVDQNEHNGLFKFEWFAAGLGEYGTEQVIDLIDKEGYSKKSFFPTKIPSIKKGKFQSGKVIEIDPDLLRIFTNNYHCRDLIASDGKYDYLSPRDVVEYPSLSHDNSSSMKDYVKITHKYKTTVEAYLSEKPDGIGKTVLEKQIGENVDGSTKISVLEFETTYYRPESDLGKSAL